MAEIERDPLTGIETTGHEWDGIKELKTPIPRWWVITLWVTVAWAIGYWVAYPAWPSLSGYTKGVLGYSSRAEHRKEMAEVEKGRAAWKGRFKQASLDDIVKNTELLNYAMAGGRAIFADNCAPCHAAGGAGVKGYPTLVDDDWLWGGKLADIQQSIKYGIRSGHEEERISEMPAFGADEVLDKKQISDVSDYVMSLSGKAEAKPKGKLVYLENCASCHGDDGKGIIEQGAPNLADPIWLYGSTRAAVSAQISKPKHGVMPAWTGRLDEVTIKQVTVYVHSLGGGR